MSQMNLEDLSVLCLDDHVLMLDIMAARLGNLGISKVVTREAAADALALIKEDLNAFDVLLCDLNMPGVNGIEFMEQLSATGYTGAVGIVSGAHDVVIQVAEAFAGARGIRFLGTLKKPVVTEDLTILLSRALA
ncbi:MAG: response regulator [Minwuia sp.]|nr:response regulator [Minwuia sp.]